MSRKLDDLSPRFRPFADRLLALLTEAGIHVVITFTGRTAAEQAQLVAEGKSKVTVSKHQSGDAIDLAPFVEWQLRGPDKVTYDLKDPVWIEIGKIGESLGLRWGGRFTPLNADGMGWDPGHFEYAPIVAPPPGGTTRDA